MRSQVLAPTPQAHRQPQTARSSGFTPEKQFLVIYGQEPLSEAESYRPPLCVHTHAQTHIFPTFLRDVLVSQANKLAQSQAPSKS